MNTKEDPWFPPLNLNGLPPGAAEWKWTDPKTNATFTDTSFWNLMHKALQHRQANPHWFNETERNPDHLFVEMIRALRIIHNLPLNNPRPNLLFKSPCAFCPG